MLRDRLKTLTTGIALLKQSQLPLLLVQVLGDVRIANLGNNAGWVFSSNTLTLIQNGFIGVDVAGGRALSITNTTFTTTYLRLASTTGNVLINTTTDAGFKLDVNGTARMGTLRLLNTSDTLEFANTLVRIRRVANTMYQCKKSEHVKLM